MAKLPYTEDEDEQLDKHYEAMRESGRDEAEIYRVSAAIHQIRESLGRPLKAREMTELLYDGTLPEPLRPPRSLRSRARSALDTVAAFFIVVVGFILVFGGGPALLAEAWQEVPELDPLVVFSIAVAPLVGYLAALLFALPGEGGGGLAPGWIWVIEGTQQKVRDATRRDLYEREHGPGSWQRRAALWAKAAWIMGLLAATVGPLLLAAWLVPELGALDDGETGTSAIAAAASAAAYVTFTAAALGIFPMLDRRSARTFQTPLEDQSLLATIATLIIELFAAFVFIAAVAAAAYLAVRGFSGELQEEPSGFAEFAVSAYVFALAAGAIGGIVGLLLRRSAS